MKQTPFQWPKALACAALGAVAGVAAGMAMAPSAARADEPRIEGATFVRLLHGVSGQSGSAPKVDLFVDGEKKLNDVEFGTLSKYLRLPSGRHTVSMWTNSPARLLLSGERLFGQGAFSTLGAYGTPQRARLLTVEDSRGPALVRQARLAVFNLSPGSPALEILASSKSGGTYILARRVRYGRTASSSVDAEPTTLRVRMAGRTLQSINTFEPRGGERYSAYVIGRAGENLRVVIGTSASQ